MFAVWVPVWEAQPHSQAIKGIEKAYFGNLGVQEIWIRSYLGSLIRRWAFWSFWSSSSPLNHLKSFSSTSHLNSLSFLNFLSFSYKNCVPWTLSSGCSAAAEPLWLLSARVWECSAESHNPAMTKTLKLLNFRIWDLDFSTVFERSEAFGALRALSAS